MSSSPFRNADLPGRLPRLPAVGGAGQVHVTPERPRVLERGQVGSPARRRHQPVPDRVHEVGVVRVGGDGVLVVEDGGALVTDQGDRVPPGPPLVGGAHHQHGAWVGIGEAARVRVLTLGWASGPQRVGVTSAVGGRAGAFAYAGWSVTCQGRICNVPGLIRRFIQVGGKRVDEANSDSRRTK
jgi:hypothetical protein